MTTTSKQRGFSLLEALVALAIAAIAFTALYRGVGQSAKVAMDVDERIAAALVARSVLASATFAEDFEDMQTGQMGDWHWRLQVNPQEVTIDGLENDLGDPPPAVHAALVQIELTRQGASQPALAWTGWKVLREQP